jgi:hypothetical protein
MKVPQRIFPTIVTPMHRANTTNVLPLITMGWTPIIITVVLRQAFQAPNSPTDKELGDSLCTSMPKRMNTPQGNVYNPH